MFKKEIKDLMYTTVGVKGCPETNNWQNLSIDAKNHKERCSFIYLAICNAPFS